MSRNIIKESDLNALLNTVNELTKSPLSPYANGKAQIGNYYLQASYGGYQVQRITSEGGGCTAPLGGGYYPKRVIYDRLNAFIYGLESAKNK